MVDFALDPNQINKVESLLRNIKNGSSLAISRSLNRTADGAKTITAKGVNQTATLKQKIIKERLKVSKARVNKLSSKLAISYKPMPLINFAARPSTVAGSKKSKKGVSFQIFRTDGRERIRHAFVAKMKNGHTGIFLRSEKKGGKGYVDRLPIEELFGPAVTTLYTKTPGLANQLETQSAIRLETELIRQVDFILSKI